MRAPDRDNPAAQAKPAGRLDFDDVVFQTNPWPLYDWHRRHMPVCWSEYTKSYFVFGYEAVRYGLTSGDFVNYHPFRRSRPAFGSSVLDTDGATHNRLRGNLATHLRPRIVQGYAERIVTPVVNSLLEVLLGERRADFAEVLAQQVPIRVACRLLGLPESDVEWLRAQLRPLLTYIDHGPVGLADVVHHRRELLAYLDTARSDKGSEGLLAALSASDHLHAFETLNHGLLFLAAATENTTAAMGNLFARVAAEPGLFPTLRRDPSLIPAVVAETLRHEPAQHVTTRYTNGDVELEGVTIPRGYAVHLCLASANRDPRVFLRPDVWYPAREHRTSMTFGVGRHHCLGKGMAQIELETALRATVERLSSLSLLAPVPPRPSGRTFRTVNGLRLSFHTANRES